MKLCHALVVFVVALSGCCPPFCVSTAPSISYDTGHSPGQYAFAPYPVSPAVRPRPIMSPSANAYALAPGGQVTVSPLRARYGNIQSVNRVQLLLYKRQYVVDSQYPSGGYWNVLADPDLHDVTTYSLNANGDLVFTVPNLSNVIPTAANIRMTCTDGNGITSVIDFERPGRADQHPLFFVPRYKVYYARHRVHVGFNALDHTVFGRVAPGFRDTYPEGWEPFCRIRHMDIADNGFPGQARFWDYATSVRSPDQQYRVAMPSGRTGFFDIQFQIVCPQGFTPSGASVLTGWGELGNYQDALLRGWPNFSQINTPPGSWFQP